MFLSSEFIDKSVELACGGKKLKRKIKVNCLLSQKRNKIILVKM